MDCIGLNGTATEWRVEAFYRSDLANDPEVAEDRNHSLPLAVKQRYDSQTNKSKIAGAEASSFTASGSVGIGCALTS